MECAVADLARRFDALVRRRPLPPPRPTERSIRTIERHFGISLPPAMIELAARAACYGDWFASLGDDFASPTHIIRVNSYWRRRRRTRALPRDLVAINLGFDADLDCLVVGAGIGDHAPVRHWSPGVTDGRRYAGFREYVEALLETWAADGSKKPPERLDRPLTPGS
jgi:alkanesulfonate monooxygenase SsuD/methylene tetrahydromethanopterin reductase-like flavin-dependent oxidoreductase (luciferase family)